MKIFVYLLAFLLMGSFSGASVTDSPQSSATGKIADSLLENTFIWSTQPRDPGALFHLGLSYENQDMTSYRDIFLDHRLELIDKSDPIDLFKEAAKLGHKRAPMKLALSYTEKGDLDSALMWLYIAMAMDKDFFERDIKEIGHYYHEDISKERVSLLKKKLTDHIKNLDEKQLRKIQKQAKDQFHVIVEKAVKNSSRSDRELEADRQKIASAYLTLAAEINVDHERVKNALSHQRMFSTYLDLNSIFYGITDSSDREYRFRLIKNAAIMGNFKAQALFGEILYLNIGSHLFVQKNSDFNELGQRRGYYPDHVWAYVWLEIATRNGNSLLKEFNKNPEEFSSEISEIKYILSKVKKRKSSIKRGMKKENLETLKKLVSTQLKWIKWKKEEHFKYIEYGNKDINYHLNIAKRNFSEVLEFPLIFMSFSSNSILENCKRIFKK